MSILAFIVPVVASMLIALMWNYKPAYLYPVVPLIICVAIVCEFLFGFGLLEQIRHETIFHGGGFVFGNETWGNWTFEANEAIWQWDYEEIPWGNWTDMGNLTSGTCFYTWH